jgi:tetratricopeptide (TPR) repeat protein
MAKGEFTIRLPQRKAYERDEWLAAAARAEGKGRYRKAIQKYREILKVDPRDYGVHAKIAPLLARVKQYEQAWSSYVAAAEAYVHQGFLDKAISLYAQASKSFPHRVDLWRKLAELKLERGLPADALRVLLEGRRANRRSQYRFQAINLLTRAQEIAPGNVPISMDLAHLLLKEGQRTQAMRLLRGLESKARGRDLRRIRWAVFKAAPSLGSGWRWLRSAVRGT